MNTRVQITATVNGAATMYRNSDCGVALKYGDFAVKTTNAG